MNLPILTMTAAEAIVDNALEEFKRRAEKIDAMGVVGLTTALNTEGMDWLAPVLGMLKTETLVRLFTILDKQRKAFEKAGESAGEASKQVEDQLLPRMRDAGVQSMKVSGTTVYVERRLWGSAKDGNAPALCEALKELGHGDMVKEGVNGQTFSAYIREIEGSVSTTPLAPADLIPKLPELLQPVVQVSEVFKIRARKG